MSYVYFGDREPGIYIGYLLVILVMSVLAILGLFIWFHPKLHKHPYRMFSLEILFMTLSYYLLLQRLYLAN